MNKNSSIANVHLGILIATGLIVAAAGCSAHGRYVSPESSSRCGAKLVICTGGTRGRLEHSAGTCRCGSLPDYMN